MPATDVDAASASRSRVPKPDQDAHNAEIAVINANIEAYKKQLNQASEALNGKGEKGSASERTKELRAKLDELTAQRNELNAERTKILDELKKLQASIRKKTDEVKASKNKLGFKSAADIDAQIADLEKQLQAGRFSLNEEKKVVSDISQLKKSKKVFEGFDSQQTSVDQDQQTIDQLRKRLDELDPKRTSVNDAYTVTRSELNALNSEKQKEWDNRNSLFEAKKEAKAKLDAEFNKLREVKAAFKQQRDVFYTQQREDHARRQAKYKEEQEQHRQEKLRIEADKERENAEIPAFSEEINQINALVQVLQVLKDGPKAGPAKAVASANVSNREVDTSLPEGAQVLTKKSDRDDDYLVMKKDRKGKKAANAAPKAEAPKPLKFDIVTVEQFFQFNVQVPTSLQEIDSTIANLEEKKQSFIDRQPEQTKRNIAAAEAKIAALAAKVARGESIESIESVESVESVEEAPSSSVEEVSA
ncbi:uncharacterized protein BJ171DRAFT_493808 [Polychytrium aggregatum]|uniref:uncharacterized protein n=1 Tax=Polychytrium aggregatum TaxID=110093 RepID=UPI0022FE3C10|nr:uncharacterized protein BJ171DRAFT_493808 [Polychytrium aggregatum]KAI9207171.1 hypothetical protein BJ171DRAFT_493808 [Polychytrium aggregatum]